MSLASSWLCKSSPRKVTVHSGMANTINELLILEKEQLGDRSGVISETSAYQFEDGTRLYNYRGDYSTWNCSIKLPNGSEERIHLKSLSEKHTGVLGPYGNELYMCLAHPPPYKIMKGVWTSPTTITFSPFRRMHYEENIHNGIGISYWHEGKGYAYRACDDPSQNAILIDCPLEKLRGLELLGIHRGKLFYTSEDTSAFPTLEKLGANVFHVKKQYMSPQHNSLCLDSSNYVYSPHEKHNFLTIDTRTMTILPLLQLKKGISIHEIIGVVEGRISMICYQDQKRYLITAQLPDGYFDQKNGVVPRMPSIVDQMNATIAELKQRDEHRTEEMERIQQRNNELEAANAQLINEKGARNNVAADTEECEKLKGELEKLTRKYHKLLMMVEMWRWRAQEVKNEEPTEKELLQQKIKELEKLLIESKVWALQDVKRTLKFNVLEKLTKPLVCIQMENAAVIYFDNVKPFELFTMNGETRQNAALQLLDREYDCAFRGAIGNHAYFCTTRGKVIKFFRTLNIDGGIKLKQINEMNTSEISLFKNQPLYLIERSKKWSVYQYHDNYSHIEGEQFDISEIDLLSKYERHYHRGVIYLFRETTTAKIERVNEKVVKVKGPLLDGVSFYTPPHSDFIYILNAEQRVIIVLNTIDLAVSQVYYEPPADANNHTIVGIHEGILTMAFDGVWGRNLSTAKMH